MNAFHSHSVAETLSIATGFASQLRRGDAVSLIGQLGAGKTVFVRGVARGLGVEDERIVASPSYVLVRQYPAKIPIYHVDLYRLTNPHAEAAELGLEEMLAEGIVIVEWADRAPDILGQGCRRVVISMEGPSSRKIEIQSPNK